VTKRRPRVRKDEEPIGIIITRERTVESAPRFSAYVYGMVDEPEDGIADDG
jgi:hypothetical protein